MAAFIVSLVVLWHVNGLAHAVPVALSGTMEFRHSGGGLSSNVMRTVIAKLPPVTPPASGVRDGEKLMRTVRLSGDYQAHHTLTTMCHFGC